MKRFLQILSGICFIPAVVCIFFFFGYSFFIGMPIFLVGALSLFLSFCLGTKNRTLIILRRIFCSLACIGALFMLFMYFVIASDMSGDDETPCDYVIVLGGGLLGEAPSPSLVDRLDRSIEYMNTYPDCIAIVSGSQPDYVDITEALAMERYLLAHGIAESRIIKEDRANDTNENMIFSRDIINSRGGGRVAILSSDYHIYRSRKMAHRRHIDSPVMISAKTTSPILKMNFTVREAFALVKAKIFGNI